VGDERERDVGERVRGRKGERKGKRGEPTAKEGENIASSLIYMPIPMEKLV
jgi:hypothetical protein